MGSFKKAFRHSAAAVNENELVKQVELERL
jgi:hypothetical protein